MVDVNGIAIYRCFKDEGSPEALGIVGPPEIDQNENETIREVAQRLVEDLIDDPNVGSERRTPKYGRAKSARIHEFSEEATVERDNGYVTKTVLDELRNGTDLEANSYVLADWYLNETQSRSDLLLIVPYSYEGYDFVGVIKTPYLDDAYETDPTEILREAERIIQRKTHKGLIYPSYDRHGDSIDTDAAKVYQSGGSYSDYWWGFVRLKENKVEDEELVEYAADGEGPFAQVSSINELADLPAAVDDADLLDAKVKIEISGIDLDVSLGDITDSSTVQLARRDNTYFVILQGGRPDIQVVEQRGRRDLFPNLEDFDDLEDVVDRLL